MSWKLMRISEIDAMYKVIMCIEHLVKTHLSHGDGIKPVGRCYLDSLMFDEKKGLWYIWFNDTNGSTGVCYER